MTKWFLSFQDYLPVSLFVKPNMGLWTRPKDIQRWWTFIDEQSQESKRKQQLDSLKFALECVKQQSMDFDYNKYIQCLVYYILSRYGIIILHQVDMGETQYKQIQVLK